MTQGIVLTVIFIVFLAFIIAILIVALTYTANKPVAPKESASTAIVEYTSSTASTTTSTSTTSSISTTTSTIPLKIMEILYSPDKIYRGDDAIISVSMGDDAKGSKLHINGDYKGVIGDSVFNLLSLEGGQHNIVLEKDGYVNGTLMLQVDIDSYATSRDVRQKMSRGEEIQHIAKGKSVIRFYDTASCSICKAVVSQLNKLVDDNRDCVVYEKLSYYKYSAKLGPGLLPFIEVEGSMGERTANGPVKMSTVKNMVESTSGCDMN